MNFVFDDDVKMIGTVSNQHDEYMETFRMIFNDIRRCVRSIKRNRNAR